MAQPTIKDVAKLAGVSISTVSRVMNKSKPVSPEAEQKVQDAITKLGFKANQLARSLVMKKSNSIGILVQDIGIDYMAQIVRGVEEVGRLDDDSHDILLSSTYDKLEQKRDSVEALYKKQVEGVVVISEDIEPEIIVKIKDFGLPYILLDRFYKANDFRTVSFDCRTAMKEITDYVISLGNKKLTYVRRDLGYEITKMKSAGFEDAVREHKLEPDIYNCETVEGLEKETEIEIGYHAAEELLGKKKLRNHAFVCESDDLAIGIYHYCYDHKISVPDDIQITGFGCSRLSQTIRPRLTTVVEGYYDIGAVAIRLLIKLLHYNSKHMGEPRKMTLDESVYLPTEIKVGESTKKRNT